MTDLATRADVAGIRADLVPLASKADVAALVSEAKFELVKWIVVIAAPSLPC
jgi:ABC-type sulfate transport system substrate-binding protein